MPSKCRKKRVASLKAMRSACMPSIRSVQNKYKDLAPFVSVVRRQTIAHKIDQKKPVKLIIFTEFVSTSC